MLPNNNSFLLPNVSIILYYLVWFAYRGYVHDLYHKKHKTFITYNIDLLTNYKSRLKKTGLREAKTHKTIYTAKKPT